MHPTVTPAGTTAPDVYDDRIFAFSALVSSVLVYNLPETVKEGDIEKLAFAVEKGRLKMTHIDDVEPKATADAEAE